MPSITAGPQEAGRPCQYCKNPIQAGQQVELCVGCGAVHHAECWQHNRGCATAGCPQAGSAGPMYGADTGAGYQAQAPSRPARTSGMAIASLVLALLAWPTMGLSILPALILGIVALVQTRRSQGALKGGRLATAGVIISGFGLLLAIILYPVFAKGREKGRQRSCLSHVKELSTGLMQYAQDYNEKYPPASNWNESLKTYVPDEYAFRCGSVKRAPAAYAMNKELSSAPLSGLRSPSETPGIYESIPGVNKYGGPELLPVPGRHVEGNNIGFADGHAKWVKDASIGSLRWQR